MKHFIKTTAAALIAALLSANLSALEFLGLGIADRIVREEIGGGLIYTEVKTTGELGSQSSYIFEYTPGEGTLPIISTNRVYGRDRLGELIGDNTLGAVNGDFYSLKTGVPMGVMINDGLLISSDDDPEMPRFAIGFKADGSTIIGKPELLLEVLNLRSGEAADLEHFNKYPSKWGAYLLDRSYSDSTTSTEASLEIVLETDGELRLGESIIGRVHEIREASQNGEIPEDCMVLTVTESSAAYSRFSGYEVGDELVISVRCAEGWEEVITAIGGGDVILENGAMPEGIIDDEHEKVSNPRTAVGVRADGSVVFYAVDGRSKSSRGLTETELAEVMAGLGCITALNLDGGGSTTVMVKYSSEADCVYVNSPSDGRPRTVGNAVLLISSEESDGIPDGLVPSEKTPLILSGSSYEVKAVIRDRAYKPIGEAESVTVIAPENAGSAVGSTFTAGDKAGLYELALSSEGLVGRLYVNITDRLDSIELLPSYSRAVFGEPTRLELLAKYRGEKVICDLERFYFTLNNMHILPDENEYPDAMLVCELGYLTKDCEFVAFEGAVGEVEIGIQLDELIGAARIRVGEGDDEIAESAIYSNTLALEMVGSGYKSETAIRAVKASVTSESALLCDTEIAAGGRSISLWVSELPNEPFCTVIDQSGKKHTLYYKVTKDYSRQLGFIELTAELPDTLSSYPCTIEILLGFSCEEGFSLDIDSARISYGDESNLPISGLEGHWAKDAILRLYDMGAIQSYDCRYEGESISYSPDKMLTRGEFAKIVSLWLGLDISDKLEGESFEADTPTEKLPYIRAVISEGIMNGTGSLDGRLLFNANSGITRQEVCKVLGLLISGENSSEYAPTDIDRVAEWARDGVEVCISAGIIGGYEDGSIRPENPVTRGELAVMLERAEGLLIV